MALSDQVSALIGKVICIESLAYRGRWLDAHHSKWAHLTECEEGKVHNKDWAQFVVRECGKRKVCIESMRYKHHYVDAYSNTFSTGGYNQGVAITHSSNIPFDKPWAQWTIECVNGMDNFRLRSEKNKLYMGVSSSLHVLHVACYNNGHIDQWRNFRIFAPS